MTEFTREDAEAMMEEYGYAKHSDCRDLVEAAYSRGYRDAKREASQARTDGGAPIGIASFMPGTDGFTMACFKAIDVPAGSPVYATLPGNATQAAGAREPRPLNGHCAAGTDGDCFHRDCPQTRDGEPHKSGRSCPLHQYSDED